VCEAFNKQISSIQKFIHEEFQWNVPYQDTAKDKFSPLLLRFHASINFEPSEKEEARELNGLSA
jgi:hypothetical protein